MTKQQRPFYPLFFALYPILSFWAFNIYQVDPVETLRSFFVILIVTALLLIILWGIIRDWHRAALLGLFYLVIFFAYGHLTEFIQGPLAGLLGVAVADFHRYFLSLLATAVIVGSWWVWRFWRRDLSKLTEMLNVITAVTLVLPTLTISSFYLQRKEVRLAQNELIQPSTTPEALPDIYYIILDAYTRADILQEVYSYNNSEFLNFLTDRGFYVASNSHSNYAQTELSLASSLNLTYLDSVVQQLGKESEDRVLLADLIQHSQVRGFLESYGYKLIAVPTGWFFSEIRDAERYLSSGSENINNFERIFLATTLPGTLYKLSISHALKRQSTLYILDTMKETTVIPGPKFVFIHLTSPHDPFVFDLNGEPTDISQQYVLSGGGFGHTAESFRKGYTDEITYLNRRVMEMVDYILQHAETPPVIIIQGDHGSGLFLDWHSAENTCARERLSILNAYLVPETAKAQLYRSITPVNTFRILFNSLFQTELDLLSERSYFSLWDRPYDFIDMTDQLEVACSE